jgi:hypothetical protein
VDTSEVWCLRDLDTEGKGRCGLYWLQGGSFRGQVQVLERFSRMDTSSIGQGMELERLAVACLQVYGVPNDGRGVGGQERGWRAATW